MRPCGRRPKNVALGTLLETAIENGPGVRMTAVVEKKDQNGMRASEKIVGEENEKVAGDEERYVGVAVENSSVSAPFVGVEMSNASVGIFFCCAGVETMIAIASVFFVGPVERRNETASAVFVKKAGVDSVQTQ
jgi:hypothetical protein